LHFYTVFEQIELLLLSPV